VAVEDVVVHAHLHQAGRGRGRERARGRKEGGGERCEEEIHEGEEKRGKRVHNK
jgi:hypothetical protein